MVMLWSNIWVDLSVQVLQQYHYNEGIIPVYKIFTVRPGRMSKHIVTQGVFMPVFLCFCCSSCCCCCWLLFKVKNLSFLIRKTFLCLWLKPLISRPCPLMSTTPNVLFPQINVIFQMYPEMIPDYLAPLFIVRVKKSRSKTKQSS